MINPDTANEVLQLTADVLEKLNIHYWIDSGTLLGAYRDKLIIPYDHDIDVRILPGQIEDTSVLVRELWKAGFIMVIQNYGKRAQLICRHKKDHLLLDLKFAFQDSKYLWVYCWRELFGLSEPRVHYYPRDFFRKMGSIELYGRKYPCPTPIEDYLQHHYGEQWRHFKESIEQADTDDLTWDYLHDPPCSVSIIGLAELRKT